MLADGASLAALVLGAEAAVGREGGIGAEVQRRQ